MHISKAIVILWIASASLACATTYGVAYHQSAMALITMEQLDLGGGQSFASALPSLFAFSISAACAVVAVGALLYSWRAYKTPLFSTQHLIALIFLAPLGIVLLSGLAK